MKTQIWSQDLLSFRSLNQESVDTLQTARTSSLVDGRLAHIVLSDDKRIELQTEKYDCYAQKPFRKAKTLILKLRY